MSTNLDTDITFYMLRLDHGHLLVGFPDDETDVRVAASALTEAGLVTEAEAQVRADEHFDAGHRDGYREAREEFEDDGANAIEAWHNESHRFVFKFCNEQPCKAYLDARGR